MLSGLYISGRDPDDITVSFAMRVSSADLDRFRSLADEDLVVWYIEPSGSGLDPTRLELSGGSVYVPGTVGYAVSTWYLNLTGADDTTTYFATASCNNAIYEPVTAFQIFYPSQIYINVEDYYVAHVDLSAMRVDLANQFRHIPGGDLITWHTSNSSTLSAHNLKLGGLYTWGTLSAASAIDSLRIFGSGSAFTAVISAYYNDVSRTIATYDYVYEPFDEDSPNLFISELSSSRFSTIISLKEQINGAYTVDVPTASGIYWLISPDLASTTTLSGLTAINDENQQYVGNYTFGVSCYPSTTAVPICSIQSGIEVISDYFTIYGAQILRLDFDPTVFSTSYSITGCYADPALIDRKYIYNFTPCYPVTSVGISADDFDNEPFVRSLTATLHNIYKNNSIDVCSNYSIVWTASAPDDYGIWAKSISGDDYTFGDTGFDSMVFYMTATESLTPQVCNIMISAQCLDVSGNSVATDRYDLTIDEFPADFNVYLKVNYEDTHYTPKMWRLVAESPYTGICVDTTETYAIPGTRIWDFDDGSIVGSSTSKIFTVSTPTICSVILSATHVSGAGWLSAHAKATEMEIVFVDNWLSANFIAYPSQTFTSSGSYVILDSTNYTQSQGVCAYGEGHTETFTLSAGASLATVFDWYIDGNLHREYSNPYELSVPTTPGQTLEPEGSSIGLTVYNNTFPGTMVSAHTGDNGEEQVYPNFSYHFTTRAIDNSNKLFQNLRMRSYEDPIVDFNLASPIVIIPSSPTLAATKTIHFGNLSPVSVQSGTYVWTLSSEKWSGTIQQVGDVFSRTILTGDGTVPGTIAEGSETLLRLTLGGTIYKIINMYPFDWQAVYTPLSTNNLEDIYAMAAPELQIFVARNYVLVGDTVIIENLTDTTVSSIISAFIWSGGGTSTYQTTGFGPFTTTYSSPGVYSISLSAVLTDGYVYSRTFRDYITVAENYTPYDQDIVRVYGATVLELPYSLDEVLLPPNEWVTAININAAFDRLEDNLEYLDGASRLYDHPPKEYFGWLGSTSVSSYHWHIKNVDADYNTLSAVTTDQLSSVNDIAFRDNLLYIANDTTIQIVSGYDATPLGSRAYKSIGDSFGSVQAIELDSRDRIFVLDKTKHRIAVYDWTPGISDPWKLLFSWGGLGGYSAKHKFQSPNDMIIDENDQVWVADTANKAIKKYTNTGSWLQTFTSPYFVGTTISTGAPISLTIDSDNNIHVLLKDRVVKFTQDGTFIKYYNFTTSGTATPKRIRRSQDDNFVYICYNNQIAKMTNEGIFAGIFANTLGTDHNSIYHTSYRDLYVAKTNSILRYNDQVSIYISREDTSTYAWGISDVYIDEDEYVQDWVYNRSFARYWDNLELFRRSITRKTYVTETQPGISGLGLEDLTLADYTTYAFPYNKRDVYIGLNEKVTAPVVNRCLKQLYQDQEALLNLLRAGEL